jgi:hypothetical protein
LAKAPDFAPKGQAKCGVEKSQAKPLIVEWPSADRTELESKVSQGLVVVHYAGCDMTVLSRCTASAAYKYHGTTRNQDKVEMKDEDELYANMPVGAAKLEGKLQRSGRLTVEMELVGRFEAEKTSVTTDELQGECAGATHFVYGVTVGAFDFYAGGRAEVSGHADIAGLGARGESRAERETLTKSGDESSCSKATTSDKAPPEGCGALIRIEVVPLAARAPRAETTSTEAAQPLVPPQPVSASQERISPPLRDDFPQPPTSPSADAQQPLEPPRRRPAAYTRRPLEQPFELVSIRPDQPSSGSAQRGTGVVFGVAGGVGLVAGGIFGGLAFSAASTAKSECPTYTNCSQQAMSDHSASTTMGDASTVAVVAGGVLLVTGLTLYFTAPKSVAQSVGVRVGPGAVSVAGGF